MKTRLLSVVLCLCLLAGAAVSLSSCKADEQETPAGAYTRMTVDINPSVELMVDDQNKVVSATALNDDGSILIAGEAFVGKTPEEAAQMVVSLATETGYLVKGEIKVESGEDEQKITITVSGDSEYAKQLREKTEAEVKKFLENNHVRATIESARAWTLDEMRKIVVDDGIFTEDEVAGMTEDQLCRALAAGRIQTAELITAEMREAYYRARDYKISFAERQATVDIINGMGDLYKVVMSGYNVALTSYGRAIDTFDELRYGLLVSPDSSYQKALARLRDAKEELVKERRLMLTVKVGDENYAEISAAFKLSEENYDKMLKAVEEAGEAANAALENTVAILRQSEAALREFESKFPEDITARLSEEAKNIEAHVNKVKDGFFAEFETAHKDDIAKIESDLKAKKQELIAAARG